MSPVAAGTLCVIGGAEDRAGSRTVLREFVRLAGEEPRIAVVATASSLGPEILDEYAAVFLELGAGAVVPLRPESRFEADDPALADRLADVDAVFMTGGNQLKLTQVIGGTRFGDAVRSAYGRGALVGGTSAGASAVSEHMIAFGDESDTPRQGVTASAAGLGLLPDVIVDQHFAQRNRYGRLLSLVARSPRLLGLGVDEDTAGVVGPDGVMEVIGRGSVTIIDGASAETDAWEVHGHRPLMISGVVLHSLPSGYRFDLRHRERVATPSLHALPGGEAASS